ncbi:MAG: hypothetical protein V3R25_09670 [Nitrosomonadaceae bacterium]
MSRRMLRHKNELCFLGTCSKKQRDNFVKVAPAQVIHAVGDVANTVLRGKLPIKSQQRKKLRKELSNLKKLALKRGSLAGKRKLLVSQRGGSILGTLWSVIKDLF